MTLVRRLQSHTPDPTASGRTMWCGPYAVAVLSRASYDAAFEDIRRLLGVKRLQGMHDRDLVAAITRPGLYRIAERARFRGAGRVPGMSYRANAAPREDRPTFAGWLRTRDRQQAYLVCLNGHYLVVAGDRVIDNQMKTWTPVGASRHRRVRVREAWRLEPA